jgi:hypothetical protein
MESTRAHRVSPGAPPQGEDAHDESPTRIEQGEPELPDKVVQSWNSLAPSCPNISPGEARSTPKTFSKNTSTQERWPSLERG